MMNKYFTLAFVGIAVAALFYCLLQPKKTVSLLDTNAKGFFDLQAHWKAGNVVALIRHSEPCAISKNECFDGDDGLTVLGVEQAIAVGRAYQQLPERVSTIYNSPVQRIAETAKYMFRGQSIGQEWLRESDKANLFQNILVQKKEGENLILVTDSSCIKALAEEKGKRVLELDIDSLEGYGGSVFLAIDPEKDKQRVHVLGYVFADDWRKIYP